MSAHRRTDPCARRRFRLPAEPPRTPWLHWPCLCLLRTRYPDLAGLLMRNWQREGLRVVYRHSLNEGFVIVAVWPRWRWVASGVFWLRALRPLPSRRKASS